MSNAIRLLAMSALMLPLVACQPGECKKPAAQISIQMAEPDAPVVRIAEQDYKLSDVLKKSDEETARAYQRFMNNMFEFKENMVQSFVQNYMIEQEAGKKAMSVEKFREKQIYGGKLVPDKARVEQLVQQWKGAPRERIEEMVLRDQKKKKEDEYLGKVESAYPYKILLERPAVNLDLSSAPSVGPSNAPITLVEFSDFQCPFCSRFGPTMKQVVEKYGEKVRRVWKNYPLPFHPKAMPAAQAALCAHEQGKFWEYHDKLFENQGNLERADLVKYAKELKLNDGKLGKCLDSGKYKVNVDKDMNEGQAAGVNGTPALFINGKLVSGAQPVEEISKIIDQELKKLPAGK